MIARTLSQAFLLGFLTSLISGCTKEIPAIDASRIQAGNGWFCHRHPRNNDSLCSRTNAECNELLTMFRQGDAKGYAKESCKPQPTSWCFVRPPGEKISWSCKIDLASCNAKRNYWNTALFETGASECFEVK